MTTRDAGLAALLAGMTAILTFGFDWTRPPRDQWGRLNCVEQHEEKYAYRDGRPHAQGGRGGMVYVTRTVCDQEATVGPVMPRWALYNYP